LGFDEAVKKVAREAINVALISALLRGERNACDRKESALRTGTFIWAHASVSEGGFVFCTGHPTAEIGAEFDEDID